MRRPAWKGLVVSRTDGARRRDDLPVRSEQLRTGLRYGYAAGNFGKSLQNSTFDLFFLFYLVDYLGAPPAVAGGLLFAVSVADCIADLVVGHIVDQRGRSGPSYRTLIISGVLASGSAFVAMFLWPMLMPGPAVAWAIGWLLLFRLGGTAVDVPHNALLAALTPNSRERGRLSTLRFLFSSTGNLAVSALIALPLSDRGHHPAGLARYVGAITALYLAVMLACILSIRHVRSSAAPRRVSLGSLVKALGELGRNSHLVRILLLCMLAASLITVFSRMALFYAQSFLGDASQASVLVSAQIAGQIASLPVWARLQAGLEKRSVALLAHAGFALTMVTFLFLSPSEMVTGAALFFLAGMGLSGLTVMHWAIVPDMIEYTEQASGVRHEALTFGLLITLTKIASSAGVGLIGLCLKLSGYQASQADGGLPLAGLLLTMTGLPLLGAGLCILILARMRISYRNHAELAERAGR